MVTPGRVAFTVFGIDIMWYGIIITLAMVLACLIVYRKAPSYGITEDDILTAFIICIPAGVIGARLYYVAFNWSLYDGDLFHILNLRTGGLAIHGGLIAGLLAAVIFCNAKRIPAGEVIDLVAPSIALAQAIGRWGNFFNEEAYGAQTDFPINVLIDGQTYHATFLYESVWCFLLFLALMAVSRKRKFRGQIFLLYAILYSVERFFVEALRSDSLMLGMLKQAQVISIAIIALGIVCYVVLYRKEKTKAHYNYLKY